jgi:hypothetical protein
LDVKTAVLVCRADEELFVEPTLVRRGASWNEEGKKAGNGGRACLAIGAW